MNPGKATQLQGSEGKLITWNDLEFFDSPMYGNIIGELLVQTEEKGLSVLPKFDDILNAFVYTPFNSVKAVILGQDPYPDKRHAQGLAFSVPEGVHPYPASLKNIFRELQDDMGCPEPTSGCLIPWTQQGVLLLNTSLTVIEGSPGSHAKLGWHSLVNEAIQKLSTERDNLVFILWGKNAQAKSTYIRGGRGHLILRATHPSPLAANKGGFFGTKPFSSTNTHLETNGIEPITWSLD